MNQNHQRLENSQESVFTGTHHHVSIADRFHLVNVVVLDRRVETRVQVVQKVHHLHRKKSQFQGVIKNSDVPTYVK